jgi:hypothetical protein
MTFEDEDLEAARTSIKRTKIILTFILNKLLTHIRVPFSAVLRSDYDITSVTKMSI